MDKNNSWWRCTQPKLRKQLSTCQREKQEENPQEKQDSRLWTSWIVLLWARHVWGTGDIKRGRLSGWPWPHHTSPLKAGFSQTSHRKRHQRFKAWGQPAYHSWLEDGVGPKQGIWAASRCREQPLADSQQGNEASVLQPQGAEVNEQQEWAWKSIFPPASRWELDFSLTRP